MLLLQVRWSHGLRAGRRGGGSGASRRRGAVARHDMCHAARVQEREGALQDAIAEKEKLALEMRTEAKARAMVATAVALYMHRGFRSRQRSGEVQCSGEAHTG